MDGVERQHGALRPWAHVVRVAVLAQSKKAYAGKSMRTSKTRRKGI
jgi:hypothetical protein